MNIINHFVDFDITHLCYPALIIILRCRVIINEKRYFSAAILSSGETPNNFIGFVTENYVAQALVTKRYGLYH
jgi:hypothetical protein